MKKSKVEAKPFFKPDYIPSLNLLDLPAYESSSDEG